MNWTEQSRTLNWKRSRFWTYCHETVHSLMMMMTLIVSEESFAKDRQTLNFFKVNTLKIKRTVQSSHSWCKQADIWTALEEWCFSNNYYKQVPLGITLYSLTRTHTCTLKHMYHTHTQFYKHNKLFHLTLFTEWVRYNMKTTHRSGNNNSLQRKNIYTNYAYNFLTTK